MAMALAPDAPLVPLLTLTLPHFPSIPVHVALFHSVANAPFLREQLLAGNREYDYAFIDAAMVLSPTHLLTALHATLTSLLFSLPPPRTRTSHSELLYRLSPSTNIAESYKTFGITSSTTTLVVVKLPVRVDGGMEEGVGGPEEGASVADQMRKVLGRSVEGNAVELGSRAEGVGRWCDLGRVRRVYKVGGGEKAGGKRGKGGKKGAGGGEMSVVNGDRAVEEELSEVEAVVLGSMALKGL